MKKILLASQSPRRAALLQQIGISFEVINVDVPEQRADGEAPKDYVLRLARDKAQAGAQAALLNAGPHHALAQPYPVLGADTIVQCQNQVLEKPQNANQGASMLALLSGNTHTVHTAIAVCQGNRCVAELVSTEVTFRHISREEAAAYWQTGEPCDKAGCYGIQGFGGVFVSHLAGSYSGVMGLPIAQTQQLLKQFSIPCWQRD